jgi:hypothetical protein
MLDNPVYLGTSSVENCSCLPKLISHRITQQIIKVMASNYNFQLKKYPNKQDYLTLKKNYKNLKSQFHMQNNNGYNK